MTREKFIGVLELSRWLNESVAAADRLLPQLLDLRPEGLRQAMAARPELRTVGVMQQLTAVAADTVTRLPHRAHQLTSVVMEFALSVDVAPLGRTGPMVVLSTEAHAWKEHGRALRALGRNHEARAALAGARERYEQLPADVWYRATVDLVDAPIVNDLGDPEAALCLIRRASAVFAQHGDQDRYVEAQMIESGILWSVGDRAAAVGVWEATEETAQTRADRTILARLRRSIALFELEHGDADRASGLLATALRLFDKAGMTRETIRTRWDLGRAAAARGRIHEAISELYKVRAELLAAGSVVEAAAVSAEILGLLLEAGRDAEASSLAAGLVVTFRNRGMRENAMEAFLYLCGRTVGGRLTPQDAATVRSYYEDLPQQPNKQFNPWEGGIRD